MIFTYSVIAGFRAILGSMGMQIAMALAIIFAVKVPEQTYVVDPSEGVNAEMKGQQESLKLFLSINHMICAFALIMGQRVDQDLFQAMQVVTIGAMLIQVLSVILVCNQVFVDDPYDAEYTDSYLKFAFWLQIELQVFIACLIANSLYLLFRSVFKQRIELQIGEILKGELTDFLESEQALAGFFVNFVAPLQISLFIDRKYEDKFGSDSGYKMLHYQMKLQWIQAISIFYLVFVSFWKCPTWFPSWIKIGPLIHLVLTLLNFLIIPLLSLFSLCANFDNVSTSMAGSALLLYPVVCVAMLFQFGIQIYPIGAQGYFHTLREQKKFAQRLGCHTAEEWDKKRAERAEEGSLNDSNLNSPLLDDETKLLREKLFPSPEPYLKIEQDHGSGSKRIGTPHNLREDMYALLFAANIRSSIKAEAEATAVKRDDALEKLIAKQMAEDGTLEDPINQEPPEEEKTPEELEKEQKKVQRDAMNVVQKQAVFLSQVMVVWVCQLLLSSLLVFEILSDPEVLEALSTYPENYWIVAARFICGVVLHMALQDELKSGLDNMKYSLNHPWRFVDYKIAWLSGFLQATIIFIVESVNFLAILTSFTVLDIVMNFLALVVISEFDDFFYEALRNEQLQDLITDSTFEKLLMIERTTSRNANVDIEEHQLTKEALNIKEKEMEELKKKMDIPTHIHQDFKKRPFFGMFGMSIYRMYRIFYVCTWFYFLPFVSLLGSYYVPYFMLKSNDPTSVDSTNDPGVSRLAEYLSAFAATIDDKAAASDWLTEHIEEAALEIIASDDASKDQEDPVADETVVEDSAAKQVTPKDDTTSKEPSKPVTPAGEKGDQVVIQQ